MTDTKITRSQVIANDIDSLLRARNPLLWIVTREESRVEKYVFEAAAAASYVARTWDVAQGTCDMNGKPVSVGRANAEDLRDPGAILTKINDCAIDGSIKRGAWIMRDLPSWLAGPQGATTLRQLRNLARMIPGVVTDQAQAIIVMSPSADVPPELSGHTTVIDWPLPDRAEIEEILDVALEAVAGQIENPVNGQRAACIDAAVGLSGEEAASCFAKSLVQTRTVDPIAVASEKKRVIARERVLEWYDPLPGGLDEVGGLENLKAWLIERKAAYSPAARAYGLPVPKGSLLVGISGCGKTLTAKAIATAYGMPLLRLDPNALKSKFVGDSEANMRKALEVIAAIGRCVVWLDEVEKSLQGATSGSADGGVSADALGTILTWMQERRGDAFVVATANDISGLPPEFLRKGRFDEVWWIDLPNDVERVEVLKAALRAHNRSKAKIDHKQVAAACKDFTGSEIAAIVPDALFTAFADGAREIETQDLIEAAGKVVPLSKTAEKKIEAMREWGSRNARPATRVISESSAPTRKLRAIDLAK